MTVTVGRKSLILGWEVAVVIALFLLGGGWKAAVAVDQFIESQQRINTDLVLIKKDLVTVLKRDSVYDANLVKIDTASKDIVFNRRNIAALQHDVRMLQSAIEGIRKPHLYIEQRTPTGMLFKPATQQNVKN